jgi:hypothetical protein
MLSLWGVRGCSALRFYGEAAGCRAEARRYEGTLSATTCLTALLRFYILRGIALAWVWRANLYVPEFIFDCAAGADGRFG